MRTTAVGTLEQRIESLFALGAGSDAPPDTAPVVSALLDALEAGAVRSAVRGADDVWRAVPWVKRGILVAFRFGTLVDLSPDGDVFSFVDKDTIPTRLGPVGGHLVGEVFASLLLADPTAWPKAEAGFAPIAAFAHAGTFGLAELINVALGRTP